MAAFVSFLVGAVPVLAEPRLWLSRPGSDAARSGDSIVIRWQGLSAEVEEMELLLSLDGGRHYALRLTESLSPESGSYEWIVPNLPTRQARLAIRAGVEGREEIHLESDSFTIESTQWPTRSFSLRVHRGELWAVTGCVAPVDDGTLPVGLAAPPVFLAPRDSVPEALPRGGPAARSDRAPSGRLAAEKSHTNLAFGRTGVAPVRISPPLRI